MVTKKAKNQPYPYGLSPHSVNTTRIQCNSIERGRIYTMSTANYKKLIDLLINENTKEAEALFHKTIVEESRKIYSELLNEDLSDETSSDFVDNVSADEEGFGMDDMEDAADSIDDEMEADADMDFEGGETEFGDGEIEDRIVDVETELDELRAEFDAILSGMDDEDLDSDMDSDDIDDEDFDMEDDLDAESDEDMDDMDDEDMDDEDMDDEDMDDEDDVKEMAIFKEYVDRVKIPCGEDNKATSPVAGKNDMGGDASNLLRNGSESNPDGTSAPKSEKAKEMGSGYQNRAGNRAKLKPAPKPKAKSE